MEGAEHANFTTVFETQEIFRTSFLLRVAHGPNLWQNCPTPGMQGPIANPVYASLVLRNLVSWSTRKNTPGKGVYFRIFFLTP